MSEDNSQQEGTNPEIEDIEIDLDEETQTDDTNIQEELNKKDEIIRHLTARAKRAEALSKNKINQPNEDLEGVKTTLSKLELAEKKRQFGYENNLSPEEADYLFKLNPKPSKELLEDPFIKGGLEAIRAAKRVAENSPSTSSRSPRFEMPKKDDLTAEDKQKAFDDYRREKFGK